MGLATIEVYAPQSMNAAPAKGTRGAGMGRHKAKKALEAELATLLLAAGVPRPIPGDRVRARAELVFPTARRRDEGNYRTGLEKALGDALSPHDPDSPLRWLSDDQPPHFTFGACTFTVDTARTPGRLPGMAIITLAWAEDLVAELERELEQLREALLASPDPEAAMSP